MLVRHIRNSRNADQDGQENNISARDLYYRHVQQRRWKEWDNYQKCHCAREDKGMNRVFLDISICNALVGRIIIDLFDKHVPRTVEYFRNMITGDAGICEHDGTKLDYLNTTLFRVDAQYNALCFGGLETMCSHVPTINEENFHFTHTEKGLVSLMYHGPGIGSSSFAILTKPSPCLDYKCVVLGKVTDGMDLVDRLSHLPVNTQGQPHKAVSISFCGILTGEKPAKTWENKHPYVCDVS